MLLIHPPSCNTPRAGPGTRPEGRALGFAAFRLTFVNFCANGSKVPAYDALQSDRGMTSRRVGYV